MLLLLYDSTAIVPGLHWLVCRHDAQTLLLVLRLFSSSLLISLYWCLSSRQSVSKMFCCLIGWITAEEKKKKNYNSNDYVFTPTKRDLNQSLAKRKKTIAAVKMLWIRQACVKLFVWSEAVRLVDPVESLHTHIYACVLGGCHRKVPPCGFPSLTSDFHLISSRLSFLPHMFLLHVRTKSTPPTPPYPPPFPPVERERK